MPQKHLTNPNFNSRNRKRFTTVKLLLQSIIKLDKFHQHTNYANFSYPSMGHFSSQNCKLNIKIKRIQKQTILQTYRNLHKSREYF